MDPNANLFEQLRLATDILDGKGDDAANATKADQLATLVVALDEWITKGGFLPDGWRRGQCTDTNA